MIVVEHWTHHQRQLGIVWIGNTYPLDVVEEGK